MIHINKSPIAPDSANRAYESTLRDEYTKHNFFMPPPHHISFYLDKALKALLINNPRLHFRKNMQMEG